MATVKEVKRKRGKAFQIQYWVRGERKWLSLGSDYEKRAALEIASVVDRLVAAVSSPLRLQVDRSISERSVGLNLRRTIFATDWSARV